VQVDPAWRRWIACYKFTLLLGALLLLVLAPLAVGDAVERSLIFGLAFIVVMLFGVLVTVDRRRLLVPALLMAGLAILAQLSAFAYGEHQFPELRLALYTGFVAFIAGLIVRDVLKAERVTWDKIQGAVCAYLLIGVAWALLYAWVEVGDPQAFARSGERAASYTGEPLFYYSFVTLTTLGYGDIAPVSQTARTLSWLEAAFGQIYLVVLVARLVSLHLTQSGDGSKSS
jgi:hypothetical protein